MVDQYKVKKLSVMITKKIEDIKLSYDSNGTTVGTKQYEALKTLQEGCDIYGLVGRNLPVCKFLYWIHYNNDIIPGFPYSWSIFGNRSGGYFDNEKDMLEDLQKYHEKLVLGSLEDYI